MGIDTNKFAAPLNLAGNSISSDPPDIRERPTQPDSRTAALEAMKAFLSMRDEAAFEHAVALYVSAARTREEPIETVITVLCQLAAGLEGPHVIDERLVHPTTMHALIFAGILRAFYGDAAVDRGIGASAQRKADAQQHIEKGSWPKRPTD